MKIFMVNQNQTDASIKNLEVCGGHITRQLPANNESLSPKNSSKSKRALQWYHNRVMGEDSEDTPEQKGEKKGDTKEWIS